jgi:hypothetical protein
VECLAYIKEVWSDLLRLSQRQRMDEAAAMSQGVDDSVSFVFWQAGKSHARELARSSSDETTMESFAAE